MAAVNGSAADAMTSPAATRGAFIVLEGLDRSGKSTQVALLEKRLVAEGKKVKVMRFPGRSLATVIQREAEGLRMDIVETGARVDEDANTA